MLYDESLTSRLTMPIIYHQKTPAATAIDHSYTDANNNRTKSGGKTLDKYSLRPRSVRRRKASSNDALEQHDDDNPKTQKAKTKPPPLSKYRRRTANARERNRMQEINQAFETLRRVVPQLTPDNTTASNEKLTKITTLRLAMKYISSLNAVLNEKETSMEFYSDLDTLLGESDGESLPTISSDFSSNASDQSLNDFAMDFESADDSLNSVDLHLEPLSPSDIHLPHHISSFDPFLSGFS